MQLNKYIAHCGVASRRHAVSIIENREIKVNGKVVLEPGVQVTPGVDNVTMNGKQLDIQAELSYILLNKPVNTLTTVTDTRGRMTVTDLIGHKDRIYPVGRLDRDTTGVLLLTNDGELAYRLAHPSFEVTKIYRAEVDGIPGNIAISRLKKGVDIDDGVTVSGDAVVIKRNKETALVDISIHQGRKHQVKKMFMAVSHPVITLDRICFAGLVYDSLPRGKWRSLMKNEVDVLYRLVGLNDNES